MSNLVAVLRRAQLDEKDRLILRVVWDNWRECRTVVWRGLLEPSGLRSLASVDRHLRRLRAEGWLSYEDYLARTMHPGPRFAGMDHGWPLEAIECKEATI